MDTNYELVKEVITFYDNEGMMDDFLSEFESGSNISEQEFFDFCNDYIDDESEITFIKKNWEYIESGGDWSILEDDEWG
jgi:hypothetical protein